jgi:formate/nitrite transporter FocA (FNT family)
MADTKSQGTGGEKTESSDDEQSPEQDEQNESKESGDDGKSSKPDSSSGPQVGTRYSAEEIHENIVEAAEEELERPVFELSYSGFASGLSIGFSFLSVALLTSRFPAEWHAIAMGIGYPLGFVFVVLARHQLFTENTLEPVIPLLERRDLDSLKKVLRLWSIVLPANLVGAFIFALVIARTRALDPALDGALLHVARETLKGGALLVFYKAIWAGWLVALMAWLIASTRETVAQIILIWLATAPIAAFGFKHSIAGASEAFYLFWTGDQRFSTVFFSFEVPALLGNIVGGVVLVALVNHGQAGGGKSDSKSK